MVASRAPKSPDANSRSHRLDADKEAAVVAPAGVARDVAVHVDRAEVAVKDGVLHREKALVAPGGRRTCRLQHEQTVSPPDEGPAKSAAPILGV